MYASRTHSQLNQVMLELKKTAYKHVKVGILGSRDQLCIHPKVSLESNVGSKVSSLNYKYAFLICFFRVSFVLYFRCICAERWSHRGHVISIIT